MQYNIPIFEATLDDERKGLFAISFVDQPAINVDFLAFSAETEGEVYLSEEKHEVVSPLMIPNQLILRKTPNGQLYYIRMGEETIKNAFDTYLSSGDFNNFTFMHQDIGDELKNRVKDDIFIKRAWLTKGDDDEANIMYGFCLPKGTFMVHLKVLNESIWSAIKAGYLRGLSLEGRFKFEDINKNVEIQYKKMEKINEKTMSLFDKLVAFVNEVSAEADDLARVAKADETNSGDVELKYYFDDEHFVTVDGEGYVRDEEMKLIEQGEYRLADGNILVVDENNKFLGTKEITQETETIEAPINEDAVVMEEKVENNEETEIILSEVEATVEEAVAEDEPKASGDTSEVDAEGADVVDEASGEDTEQEVVEEEHPETVLSQIQIGDVVYSAEAEVIKKIEELEAELAQLRDVTPSAKPIGVVKNGQVNDDVISVDDAIMRLNAFRM